MTKKQSQRIRILREDVKRKRSLLIKIKTDLNYILNHKSIFKYTILTSRIELINKELKDGLLK